jgi:hypothetical protein
MPLSNTASRYLLRGILCSPVAICFPTALAQIPDTLSSETDPAIALAVEARRTSFLYTALSTSYSTSTNWQGQDLRNFSFLGNVQYRHGAIGAGHSHAHQLLADLGYLKFVDSIWVKSVDRLQVQLLWGHEAARMRHSYSLLLNTQFLPTTSWQYVPESGGSRAVQLGGLLRPFSLEAGYGAVLSFWGASSLNLAFATLKLAGYPKEMVAPAFREATLVQAPTMNYYASYGFGLVTSINRSFGRHVQWINNSRAFCNGFDKDHVSFELTNMLIVKLWKYIQFRFDTRLAYNPMLNYDLQLRQEALVGFFFERNK